MDNTSIEIKLPIGKVADLYALYETLKANYMPATAHEELLRTHIFDMAAKLFSMQLKCKKRPVLKLCGSEALAFCQLWERIDLRPDPYTFTLINKITAEIDQYRKSPLRQIPTSFTH